MSHGDTTDHPMPEDPIIVVAPQQGAPLSVGHRHPGPLISVIIPTYHRSTLLIRAVGSVLTQQLDSHPVNIQLVISISDAGCRDDIATAQRCTADRRVTTATASRLGPAAARNAGLRVATGRYLAFLDDDCVAAPGWLAAGVQALQNADLVQGRTVPEDIPSRWDHAISVDRLTNRWETCNLFVTREAVERGGFFDEEFHPQQRDDVHWGEDTEWGWRLIRHGARYLFNPDAVVVHAVIPRSRACAIRRLAQLRFFPYLVRRAPEARHALYLRYFVNPRHILFPLSVAASAIFVVAILHGALWWGGAGFIVTTTVPYIQRDRHGRLMFRYIIKRFGQDLFELLCALYGSLRWRRLVI